MQRNDYEMRWCGRLPVAACLLLALLASGCSSSSVNAVSTGAPSAAASPPSASSPASTGTLAATAPPAPPPAAAPAPSFKDKIENFFSTNAAKAPQPVTNTRQANVDCPFIDIRQGASTLTIPPPPPDGSNDAMSVKYQGDFVRAARECRVVGDQLVMKIGVQGRIIVGPAGGPGQVEVPLRIAVVEAPTAGSKTVVTKLVRVPVAVESVDANTTFTHIEDGLSFPLPSSSVLDSYIVYIGFDPIGAAAEDTHKAKPVVKKPRPKGNPSAPTG